MGVCCYALIVSLVVWTTYITIILDQFNRDVKCGLSLCKNRNKLMLDQQPSAGNLSSSIQLIHRRNFGEGESPPVVKRTKKGSSNVIGDAPMPSQLTEAENFLPTHAPLSPQTASQILLYLSTQSIKI